MNALGYLALALGSVAGAFVGIALGVVVFAKIVGRGWVCTRCSGKMRGNEA